MTKGLKLLNVNLGGENSENMLKFVLIHWILLKHFRLGKPKF